ncbi:hypothetical protein [Flavihumibacter sp. UBA7668]|uniref:hypothetical protein n=1 Tax=Flavihumibacter sp. UBA7668 TaxID=1946542 RepID=UPI0025BE5E74|nr:hypothetical protein [Flavihumibacter sp. UBA7668]
MKQFLLIAAVLFSMELFAQEDSISTFEESPHSTLTFAALYHNNASYYGQTAEEKMPFAAAYLGLRFPSGIYMSALAYRLLNQPGKLISASSFGIGWEFPLYKKLVLDLSYNHSFFSENSGFVQAANSDIASAGLSYKHWLTTTITADFAFGQENDVFGTISNSKKFELGTLFTKKETWTLTPSVDITAGTQRFYQSYITEKIVRDSLLGLPLPTSRSESDTATVSAREINLLSYNLRVPLAYSRSHYLIELAYQLSVLSDKVHTTDRRPRSFLNLSFYYQF